MKANYFVLALAAGLIGGSLSAAAQGVYLRKGAEKINVAIKGGRLFCTRASDGFEMCHGMARSGKTWTGSNMKHPDMPGFMTFNGTVTIGAKALSIKGCAIGQSMCDAETWSKQ